MGVAEVETVLRFWQALESHDEAPSAAGLA
jgi:hypothetical protein